MFQEAPVLPDENPFLKGVARSPTTAAQAAASEEEKGLLRRIAGAGQAFVLDPLNEIATFLRVSGDAILEGRIGPGSLLRAAIDEDFTVGDALLNNVPFYGAKRAIEQGGANAETQKRAMKGLALLAGFAAGGVTGGAVRTVGSRVLTKSIFGTGLKRATTWGIEGAAFGATFGSLRPLTENELDRSDAILSDAVTVGLFSAALGGVSPLVGAGVRPIAERIRGRFGPGRLTPERKRELLLPMRDALLAEDRVAPGFARGATQPLAAEGLVAEEVAAQGIAGRNASSSLGRPGVLTTAARLSSRAVAALVDRFPEVQRLSPDLAQAAFEKLGARFVGGFVSRNFTRIALAGLSQDEKLLVGRAIVASRLRGAAERNINMVTELSMRMGAGEKLTPLEKDLLANVKEVVTSAHKLEGFASSIISEEERSLLTSPGTRTALELIEEVIEPIARHYYVRNGGTSFATTELPFLNLIPATLRDFDALVPVVRNPNFRGAATKEAVFEGAAQGAAVRARVSPFARMARGEAPAYVIDPEIIIERSLSKAFSVDRSNELIVRLLSDPNVRRVKATQRADGSVFVPKAAEGREVVAVRGSEMVLEKRLGTVIDEADAAALASVMKEPGKAAEVISLVDAEGLGGLGKAQPIVGWYEMPKPYARMLREIQDDPFRQSGKLIEFAATNPLGRALGTFMDWHVGLLLASSVEVAAHSMRILAELTKTPGVGPEGLSRLGQHLIPMIGPRMGAILSMTRATEGAEGRLMATRIQRITGTSGRFLQYLGDVGPVAAVRRRHPEAAELMELGRDFLFDLPEFGSRSLYGFDERARIVGAVTMNRTIRKELGRDLTDAELRRYLESFGKYNNVLTSNLVNFLRASKLNPFIGGQSGLIVGEIRKAYGGLGLPESVVNELSRQTLLRLKAEVLYRGVAGTALAATLLQYASTQTFPWDNEKRGIPVTDIVVGETEDGRPISLPFNTYAPGLARAFRITGIRALVENFGDPQAILDETSRSLVNSAIQYGGASPPAASQITTLVAGRAPFLTPSGELLQIVPPQPTLSLTFKERALTAAGTANPTIEELFGFAYNDRATPTGVRVINALTPGLRVGPPPKRGEAMSVARERGRLFNIVEDRVRRALNENPESFPARMAFYRAEAAKFPDLAERQAALQAMIRQDLQRLRSTEVNRARARIERPFP